jgi:glycosyltransferase involved in cell wall biosynthesis
MILHYLNDLRRELGGVVQSVLTICDALAASGNTVCLCSQNPRDYPSVWDETADSPKVEPIAKAGMFGQFDRATTGKLHDLIAQADVVHLHTPWDLANMAIARIAKQQQKPILLSLHGMLDHWSLQQKALKKKIFLQLTGKRFLRSIDRLHCTAQSEKDQALEVLGNQMANRFEVIPLIVDLATGSDDPGNNPHDQAATKDEKPILLFLGRVHPQKGVDLLIEAARHLHQKGIPFRIVIAGPIEPGYRQSLENLAASYELGSLIEFTGALYGPEKRSLLSHAAITVLPTYQESFGLVSVESLACGTPVITTKESDIWQELQDAGVSIVSHDPKEICAAIIELLEDKQLAIDRGQMGQKYVLEWLDREKVIKQYQHAYHNLMASR